MRNANDVAMVSGPPYRDAIIVAVAAIVSTGSHHAGDADRAARFTCAFGSLTLFGVFVMMSSLRRDAGYVIVTLSCWAFWTNWAAGSEAAASNWDLFTMVNCDIGSPFHLTPSIREGAICSVGGERIGPADL
jgi:hypothetical protein